MYSFSAEHIEALKNPDVSILYPKTDAIDEGLSLPSEFNWLQTETERQAFAMAVNARKRVYAARGQGCGALQEIEAAVRKEFVRLGVPLNLYDCLRGWQMFFWDELKAEAYANPDSEEPTVRYDR